MSLFLKETSLKKATTTTTTTTLFYRHERGRPTGERRRTSSSRSKSTSSSSEKSFVIRSERRLRGVPMVGAFLFFSSRSTDGVLLCLLLLSFSLSLSL